MPAAAWMAQRGWAPFDFQRQVWAAMAAGQGGLLHASTGSGKTYAVALGALLRAQALGVALQGRGAPPLGVLWVTPMRALAADTTRAWAPPLADLAPAWTLGQRSGDTPGAERARQDKRLPTVLVSTPESLTLLLTRDDAQARLAGVHTVIVDEWHELVGNKRGVQVQLLLARLALWNPRLLVWGLSATLGNLDAALAMLQGPQPPGDGPPRLVRGRIDKALRIDTLLPAKPGRFSWGGHLGAQMVQPVVDEIERTDAAGAGSTLVFTNVRSQAEAWYQMLLNARPDWAGQIALHHGSLAKDVRAWVEAGLKAGTLKAVVATSSLDLGVDFLPVSRVMQIGSAKGVARLLQRAGRSGHQPGRPSRVTLVPTNTLELIEAVAARRAVAAGRVEPCFAPHQPLDVPDAQRRLSALPAPGGLLLEQLASREGHHLFLYPFAGRHVHLGLASLLGWRLSQQRPNTFSISVNDYGFELLAAEPVGLASLLDQTVFDAGPDLLPDMLASLNSSELARRRFREIARVAGLVFSGYPGAPKSTRQLQASSSLFYDVFRQYDPANRLLGQADAEVLAQELDLQQLSACLARLRGERLQAVTLQTPSPFALALMVERFREQLSTEKLADRLARIVADAERVLADPALPAGRRRRRSAAA